MARPAANPAPGGRGPCRRAGRGRGAPRAASRPGSASGERRQDALDQQAGAHRVLEREVAALARAQHRDVTALPERPSRGGADVDEAPRRRWPAPAAAASMALVPLVVVRTSVRPATRSRGELERRVAEVEAFDRLAAALAGEERRRAVAAARRRASSAVVHRHDARRQPAAQAVTIVVVARSTSTTSDGGDARASAGNPPPAAARRAPAPVERPRGRGARGS